MKSLTITKNWDDYGSSQADMVNRFRPDSVSFTVTGRDSSGAVVYTRTGVLSKSLGYQATLRNLPVFDETGAYIQYTVTENSVPRGYQYAGGTQPNSNTVGNMSASFTNTLNPMSVYVEKHWQGQDPQTAPAVTINLRADGVVIQSVLLSPSNGWVHTFMNLPRYTANGVAIQYSLSELAPSGFAPSAQRIEPPNGAAIGFSITNSPGTPPPGGPGNTVGGSELLTKIDNQGTPLAGAGSLKHLGDCFD